MRLYCNIFQVLAEQPDTHTPAVLDSEDYLFMLYTSGSTGKPKGIVHTQAGYLLYANMTMKVNFLQKCVYAIMIEIKLKVSL